MTTINNIEDLVRVLDENPEWLEALRARLLSRELLELPDRFAQFSAEMSQLRAEVNRFVEEMNQFRAEVNRFVEEMNEFRAEVNRFVEEMNQFRAEMNRFVADTNLRFNRVEADMGNLKGVLVRREAIEHATVSAREMGLRRTKTLAPDDVWDLADSVDTSGISTDDLRSFRRADLIMETVDSEGETHYVAVEISFTVNGRDTSRAIRNAEFLTRFTGKRSHAVVSGIELDYRVRSIAESGEVFWYQLDPGLLEPE